MLRDRSVRWVYSICQSLNQQELIKKVSVSTLWNNAPHIIHLIDIQAFELCRARDFNLSYESLTSYNFRQILREL
ncbi:MAG TPA: hypothetical protein VGO47_14840, partial [Chlamydiales bacterium]|nr:hypothetical protein [Chlamydiales bacterium]